VRSENGSKMFISNEYLDVYVDDETVPFELDGNTENSYVYEETVRSGDIVDISIQGVYIKNATTLNFEPTNGTWQYKGVGDTYLREELIMQQMLRLQQGFVKVYNGTILQSNDLIRYSDRIQYRNELFLPVNLTINYDAASVSGQWFKLIDATPANVTTRRGTRKKGGTRLRENLNFNDLGLDNNLNEPDTIKPLTIISTLSGQQTFDITSYNVKAQGTHSDDEIEANITIKVGNILLDYVSGDPDGISNTWGFWPDFTTIKFWRPLDGKMVFQEWNHYNITYETAQA